MHFFFFQTNESLPLILLPFTAFSISSSQASKSPFNTSLSCRSVNMGCSRAILVFFCSDSKASVQLCCRKCFRQRRMASCSRYYWNTRKPLRHGDFSSDQHCWQLPVNLPRDRISYPRRTKGSRAHGGRLCERHCKLCRHLLSNSIEIIQFAIINLISIQERECMVPQISGVTIISPPSAWPCCSRPTRSTEQEKAVAISVT